jgi:TolB protein
VRGRFLAGRCTRITVVGLGVVAVLVALPAVATATFPGKNGKIAILRQSLGIYTVNPDGSGLTFVTSGQEPDWSPDGKHLAFRRNDGIYVSNADGSSATRIVTGSDVVNPAWSPDGNQLVYVKPGER